MKRFMIIIYILFLSQYSLGQTSEIIYSYSKSKVGAQTNHIFASETDTITICQGTTAKPLPLVLTKDKKINLKEDAKRKAYDFIDEQNRVLAAIDVQSKMKPVFDIVMPDSTRLVWNKYNKKNWTYSMDGIEVMSCYFKKSADPKLTIKFATEVSPAMRYAVITSQCRVLWRFYDATLYPAQIGVAALRTLVM
jgi:hypothetical protein